jgi:hypothetical protein
MTDTAISVPSGAAPDSAPAPVTSSVEIAAPDTSPKAPAARDANGRFAGNDTTPSLAEDAADIPPPEEVDPLKAEADAVKDNDSKRKSAKERIDQITAQKHAALKDAAFHKQQKEAALTDAAFHRQNAEQLAAQLKKLNSEPDTGDLTIDMRKAVKTENLEQAASNYHRANHQAQQAMVQEFGAKIESARAIIPNIDSALTVFYDLKISDAACDFIASSDKAADIAYFLGQNPQEGRRIEALPVPRQTAELARIEAKLTAPEPKRVSTAPKPAQTLSGGVNPLQFDATRASADDMAGYLRKQGIIR